MVELNSAVIHRVIGSTLAAEFAALGAPVVQKDFYWSQFWQENFKFVLIGDHD